MSDLTFLYSFSTESLKEKSDINYRVTIDSKSMLLVEKKTTAAEPDWTLLEYHQCQHCPLTKEDTPRCPIAKNLHYLFKKFQTVKSVETYSVKVESPERTYFKITDIQNCLGSLFGLIMATSSCPTMDFLKPMARFHLPFATIEETIIRSLGSFLIGKYLQNHDSGIPINIHDIKKEMTDHYTKVNEINSKLIKRIEHLVNKENSGDADQNAIIILDTLAVLLTMELSKDLEIISNIYMRTSP